MLGLVALGGGSLVSGRAAQAPDVAAAIALYDEGSYSAARIRFNEIARVRPNDPEIDLYRGQLALWFDDAAAGLAFATVYLTEEKFDQAFREFDELLRQKPDDFFALYQIGRCAALSGMQLDRGLAALQRCLQLPLPADTDRRTTLANIHYRLGNILEKKGDPAAAQAEYTVARQVYPDFRSDKDTLRD